MDSLTSLKGLSGAPVFDETQNALCGMVVRVGIDRENRILTVNFVSAVHINQLLETIASSSKIARYEAPVYRPDR